MRASQAALLALAAALAGALALVALRSHALARSVAALRASAPRLSPPEPLALALAAALTAAASPASRVLLQTPAALSAVDGSALLPFALRVEGDLVALGAAASGALTTHVDGSVAAGDAVSVDNSGAVHAGYGPYPSRFLGVALSVNGSLARVALPGSTHRTSVAQLLAAPQLSASAGPALRASNSTAVLAMSVAPGVVHFPRLADARVWCDPGVSNPSEVHVVPGNSSTHWLHLRVGCFPVGVGFNFEMWLERAGGEPLTQLMAPRWGALNLNAGESWNVSVFVGAMRLCESTGPARLVILTDCASFPRFHIDFTNIFVASPLQVVSTGNSGYGFSVDMSRNSLGLPYVVIGFWDDQSAMPSGGSVEIYQGTRAELGYTNWVFSSRVRASSPDLGIVGNGVSAAFGFSVAAARETIVIASHEGSAQGGEAVTGFVAVVRYSRSSNSWAASQAVFSPKMFRPSHASIDACDITEDGAYFVVASPAFNGSQGSVAVFRDTEDGQYVLHAELAPPDGAGDTLFGSCVGIWGQWIIVGEVLADHEGENSGRVHMFRINADGTVTLTFSFSAPSSPWSRLGSACDVRGSYAAVASDNGINNGTTKNIVVLERNASDHWNVASIVAHDSAFGVGSGLSFIGNESILISQATRGSLPIKRQSDGTWAEQTPYTWDPATGQIINFMGAGGTDGYVVGAQGYWNSTGQPVSVLRADMCLV